MPESRPTIHVSGGTVEQRALIARHIELMPIGYDHVYLLPGRLSALPSPGVPANPELDEAMHGAGDVPLPWFGPSEPRTWYERTGSAPWKIEHNASPDTRVNEMPVNRETLYEKLIASDHRKAVTIALPERGIDGKTVRHSAAEKELVAVFGGYTATHGVRASADGAKTPIILYSVTVVDDLGVRDAVGIAGRGAALTGAPVTMTLDDGNVVRVDAEGRFL